MMTMSMVMMMMEASVSIVEVMVSGELTKMIFPISSLTLILFTVYPPEAERPKSNFRRTQIQTDRQTQTALGQRQTERTSIACSKVTVSYYIYAVVLAVLW